MSLCFPFSCCDEADSDKKMVETTVDLYLECFQNGVPLMPDKLIVSTNFPLEIEVWSCPRTGDRTRTLIYTQTIDAGLLKTFESVKKKGQEKQEKKIKNCANLFACPKSLNCMRHRCDFLHGIFDKKQDESKTLNTSVCLKGLLGTCMYGTNCVQRHFMCLKPLSSTQIWKYVQLAQFYVIGLKDPPMIPPPFIMGTNKTLINFILPDAPTTKLQKLNVDAPEWFPPTK